MGLFTDFRKKWSGTPSSSLDGHGERSSASSVSRSKTGSATKTQQQRPQGLGLAAGAQSQDSGVVIIPKDSNVTLTAVPDHVCPNCAAAAASAAPSRSNPSHQRPSMERMRSFASSQQPMPHRGHAHEQCRTADIGHEQSRPGTGYSNQSGVPPMQTQQHHQHHDVGFSQRPLSWGRRATTENVNQDAPPGYTRPVTPPYSIRSEQIGWNSGQQYNNMYQHVPGPASYDGCFSLRPLSWRRATSSHLNSESDQRQPRSFNTPSQSSRTPSEAGSAHPRNASKNMENTAYEAGYRDAIARLRADAERW